MINDFGQGSFDRRTMVKRIISGTAAVALAGVVVAGGFSSSVSAGTAYFRTTAALNLRSQSNTSSVVILVIPNGGMVAQAGPEQYGFTKVSYNGNIGWAKSEFL